MVRFAGIAFHLGNIGYNVQNVLSIPNGGAIMVKSKTKREKPEETTEEFVKRINQGHKDLGKRNGSKRKTGHHHR